MFKIDMVKLVILLLMRPFIKFDCSSWFIVENKEDFIVENKEDLLIYLRLK
jgi:hypothetical protein